jgi:hypothetical protein
MRRIKSLNFPDSMTPPFPRPEKKLGQTPLGQVQLDDFDFEQVIFEDSYERPCVIGQSSVAEFEPPGSSALWIGLASMTHDGQKAAMHLSLNQVRALIATLEIWVKRGTLDENYRRGKTR